MEAKTFADRVNEARMRSGKSQAKLADEAGISRNYLSQIERGEAQNLSWQVKTNLAEVLGISAEDEDPEELPLGLKEFTEEYKLQPDDIAMLARLEYRGKKPTTPEQWKFLYKVIKSVIVEE